MRFVLSLLAASLAVSLTLEGEENVFTSAREHFSVRYPPSWRSLGYSQGLDIVNFPLNEQVRGVILPEGGARITVLRKPDHIASIEDWIREDLLDVKAETRRELRGTPAPDGCSKFVEVKWQWDAGGAPDVYFQETAYYCVTRVGLYRIQLTHWSDNPSRQDLQETALNVARSLKTLK
jgi:hypothetical protein